MKPLNIDSLVSTSTQINGKWVIAEPLELFGFWRYIYRVRDAILVLKGAARAITFTKS